MGRPLVLLSGGLDSTMCLRYATEEGEPVALGLSYGQRMPYELHAAERIAEFYDATWLWRKLPESIFQTEKSALTGSADMYADTGAPTTATYVPFRNGTFISVATALALTLGCDSVWAGANAGDIHPDSSLEFMNAMAKAVSVGTAGQVRLVTPLAMMDKPDIIRAAVALGAPLELTYSCYSGWEEPCRVCPSCVRRAAAFERAGMPDPALEAIA